MSREIKFRAWDNKNRQFADYEDVEECLSCRDRDGWKSSDGIGCCFGINAVEVLADCIIEQYTGLKDKNGKEIYEGDIVKIWNGKYSGDALGGGYAIEGHWFPMVREVKMDTRGVYAEYPGYMLLRNFANIEVIGNIHENPELLGGKE